MHSSALTSRIGHDLLFDPGLQFRPTTSRRKQLATERYWVALTREIEHGCTCTAWNATGVMVTCGCEKREYVPGILRRRKRARPPTPPPWSDRYYTAYLSASADPSFGNPVGPEGSKDCDDLEDDRPAFQISVPSRVRPMLQELIAVLKSVIVPPPLPSSHTSAAAPSRLPPQSSSDAQHLLSHFDPPLIEQELQRRMFDPSGLFGLVGETLKRHCAPMRDRQVDAMIALAKGTEDTMIQRAVSTMRMCFEILELMKLVRAAQILQGLSHNMHFTQDIANHQLQHLRPFLAASTPDFELRVFVERCRRNLTSPRIVRVWLQNAWDRVNLRSLSPSVVQSHVTENDEELPSSTRPAHILSRRMRVNMSLIDAITNLVFNPLPSPVSAAPSFGYPETLYLDTARVTVLAADAADLTALYMLLMLWRQLVFWTPTSGETDGDDQGCADVFPRYTRSTPRLEEWEVDRVKREIWEIGPRRIGSCFLFSGGKDGCVCAPNRIALSESGSCAYF